MALDRVETRAGAARRRKRLEEKDEQLLLGIPNEISVDVIAAKLSWKDICVLSSVSRGWYQAVQSRGVYRARVRSQSTELLTTFSIAPDIKSGVKQIVLRSTRDNSCFYQLPPIPGLPGLPLWSSLVPLDGRIFLMGGKQKSLDVDCSNKVYVLDLAGEKQWKPCAKMKQARGYFACTELDGKIYVFGGIRSTKAGEDYPIEPVCGSEVYDPKENTWKSIKASPNWRFLHVAVPIGPALVMYAGLVWEPSQEGGRFGSINRANVLEAYHPGKDEWGVPSNRDNCAGSSATLADLTRVSEVIGSASGVPSFQI